MTTQEQLKTYAAYLPYIATAETVLGTKFIMKGISYKGILQDEKGFDMGAMGVTKLHLWDLSYFEKYFAKLFDTDIDVRTFLNEGFITEENQFESISDMINNYKVEWWPYGVIQLALRHHFNVFGIPAGEFIDKATLKTESND